MSRGNSCRRCNYTLCTITSFLSKYHGPLCLGNPNKCKYPGLNKEMYFRNRSSTCKGGQKDILHYVSRSMGPSFEEISESECFNVGGEQLRRQTPTRGMKSLTDKPFQLSFRLRCAASALQRCLRQIHE